MINIEHNKSKFLVFEGIDGSGKTTQTLKLKEYLIKNNFKVELFREPSNSKWGQEIRELAKKNNSISEDQELKLFLKDRRWNVKNNIIPALNKKRVVILDRYFYSTLCYQGARGFNTSEILISNLKFAPIPDAVFLIDIDVKRALERIKNNRKEISELFEREEFLLEVRKRYQKLKFNNIKRINGNLGIEQIFDSIMKNIIIN